MCPPKQRRPSMRAFLTNLGAPQPWPAKLKALLHNNWLKFRRLEDCCGHPGEPGC